jgi:hypothetical protein
MIVVEDAVTEQSQEMHSAEGEIPERAVAGVASTSNIIGKQERLLAELTKDMPGAGAWFAVFLTI